MTIVEVIASGVIPSAKSIARGDEIGKTFGPSAILLIGKIYGRYVYSAY